MQKKKRGLQRLILACLFAAAVCRRDTFVEKKMTWFEARDYCLEHHNDLTSISNEHQDEDLQRYGGKAWIGLHKHGNQAWKWAGGENATFFSSLVLVQEEKTWEAAMLHCHDRNRSLVSVPSHAALQETLAAVRGAAAAAARVWTGLRYLGDGWLWVSACPARHLEAAGHVTAPQCPGWTQRCGALSLHGEAVEGWDCADRLHFVCSKT